MDDPEPSVEEGSLSGPQPCAVLKHVELGAAGHWSSCQRDKPGQVTSPSEPQVSMYSLRAVPLYPGLVGGGFAILY